MKKLVFISLTLCVFLFVACAQKSGPYIDGVYNGKTQAQYTYEPYVGYITITVKNGWPVDADFKIVDTAKNEIFNESYEKYFEGNEHYINQCQNDWKGVQTYPKLLKKVQNIEKVDAITGATWSYNFFKFASLDALKNAKK
ncbi:MAG: hypothetical protein EHM93_05340 [Bacteroidales bacterium]|nr:MAG: hypothetical protein EHM93_05340 [Bacteroidales bacterium]